MMPVGFLAKVYATRQSGDFANSIRSFDGQVFWAGPGTS